MHIFSASLPLDIVLTALIAATIIAVFVVEHVFLKKNEDVLKRHQVLLIYGAALILLVGGIIGIMAVWSFDFVTFFNGLWTTISAFIIDSVPALIGTAVAIFVAIVVLRILRLSFRQIGKNPGPSQRRKKTIGKVSLSISNYLVAIIVIIVILAIWGFNVVPALAGLGIAGLVIGLGAQKFINDLIAGFFIIFEHHFDVGDVIEVTGFKGEVIDIGLKTTQVRNWKGEIRIMNNGDVTNVINYSRNPSVAIVEFDIAYKEDIQTTINILKEELPKLKDMYPDIIENPSVIGVVNLADSGVTLRVIAKTENEKHYGIERALRQFVKETLDAKGIEIPFPQVVVNQPKR